MLPPVSVPRETAHVREETEAAEPPEDPPGTRVRSQGLDVTCGNGVRRQVVMDKVGIRFGLRFGFRFGFRFGIRFGVRFGIRFGIRFGVGYGRDEMKWRNGCDGMEWGNGCDVHEGRKVIDSLC
jgi:hypothetical protein